MQEKLDNQIIRLKLVVSYDGTNFSGWQRQNDKPTIQGEIEKAFFSVTQKQISIIGSGRTDEGVHAIAQVCHADIDKGMLVKFDSLDKLKVALNHYLPDSIFVKKIVKAKSVFHACTTAIKKIYVYDFYMGDKNPLLENKAFYVSKKINIKSMQEAAKEFVGSHDFIAFRAKGSTEVATTVREVFDCRITASNLYNSKTYRLTISASGFLYKMVRIIMGSLIKVGEGKLTTNDIKTLLDNSTEWDKKTPAPSSGLYLLKVVY